MSLPSLVLAIPGAIVAVTSVLLLATSPYKGRSRPARWWTRALLVTVLLSAVVGVSRTFVEDLQIGYALNMGLMVIETLTHVALVGWIAYLPGRYAAWLRHRHVVIALATLCATLLLWFALDPEAFIGRIGRLDGVPALVRLDAGLGGAIWGGLALAVRSYSVIVARDACHRGAPGWARQPPCLLVMLVMFLATFLVWLSNPVVIHYTGNAWLPGVVRFLLPQAWALCLLAAIHCAGPAPPRPAT